MQTSGGWTSELLLDTALTVTTFGEDENGEVYVADFSSGTVYRIVEVFPGISFTTASGGGGGCFITIVLQ
jgi:hypothetical protein